MGIVHKVYTLLGGKEGSFLQKKWSKYCIGKDLKRKQKLLRQYGIEALQAFKDICQESGVGYWLEFGTLLGAVRHKSFIPHDFDLDVGILEDSYTEDFEKKLIAKGFVKDHSFDMVKVPTGERKPSEYAFHYKGLAFDIFLGIREGDTRTVYCYEVEKGDIVSSTRSYTFSTKEPLSTVTINGVELSAPADPVKTLSMYYGEDFMTPNPNWTGKNGGNKCATYYTPEEITGILIRPKTDVR